MKVIAVFSFFPRIYPEENFQGIIGRYRYYTACPSVRLAIQETLGPHKQSCCVEVPNGLEFFAQKYGLYDSDYFIDKHTLLPLFRPFLSSEQQKEITLLVKNGGSFYRKLGLGEGMKLKSGLAYCPICIKEDVNRYGEAYFHRIHQMPLILTCPEHYCYLKEYPIVKNKKNKMELFKINSENFNLVPFYEDNEYIATNLQRVANNAVEILQMDINTNFNIVYDRYRIFLKMGGFLLKDGRINFKYLLDKFQMFYDNDLLEKMHLNNEGFLKWLKRLLHEKKGLHPIKNILFIQFLAGSVKSFFTHEVSEKQYEIKKNKNSLKELNSNPYGKGPWVCLNPVVNHYKQFVIKRCRVTYNKKGIPTGKFYCDCGYSYSKAGSDLTWEDNFRKDRVISFGELWQQRLKELVENHGVTSIGELAKIMGCNRQVIVPYALKLGIFERLDTRSNPKNREIIQGRFDKTLEERIAEKREVLLNFIKSNPSLNRTKIEHKLMAEYRFLSKYDKDWLYGILPLSGQNGKKMIINNHDLDLKYSNLLIQSYKEICNFDKPIRITKKLLIKNAKEIPQRNDKLLNKLTNTSRLLLELPESWEQFRIRRIHFAVKKLCEQGIKLTQSKIIRKANITPEFYTPIIEEYINNILAKLS